MKNPKKLNCHFWCLDQCLLKINTKCAFDWKNYIETLLKKYPSHSGGKKKLEHKVQSRSIKVLKNLRIVLGRKEFK